MREPFLPTIADIYQRGKKNGISILKCAMKTAERFTKSYSSSHSVNSSRWNIMGIIWLQGGLGGLGYILAKHLSEKWKAKSHINGAFWFNWAGEKDRIFKKFRFNSWTPIWCFKTSDAERIFAFFKKQFGTHSISYFTVAGVLRDSFILRRQKEEIDQVGSKVYSARWLAEEKWRKLNYLSCFHPHRQSSAQPANVTMLSLWISIWPPIESAERG